ncbi:MAG: tetratricopeptide repeat protein [Blastocatellia bacterium]|nr:tetratricopeptide repeat protein [Blastocatellia bacterium]
MNQRIGIQQVGEATAQFSRKVSKPALTEVERLVLDAEKFFEKENYDKAAQLYEKAVLKQPTLASAKIGWGASLISNGDIERGEQKLEEVAATSLKDPEDLLDLGVAFYRIGKVERAISFYEKAVAVKKSSFSEAYFNLGMAYAHQKNLPKALENYKLAVSQRKDYAEAYNNIGLIYEAMGEAEQSITYFKLAIEKRGGNYALAHYNLARRYGYQGIATKQQTIKGYDTAIKQKSDFAEAYLNLGNVYLVSGEERNSLTKAVEFYEVALKYREGAGKEAEGHYPLAHENLAIALTKQGNKTKAYHHYRKALETYDMSLRTLQNITSTLFDEGLFLIGNELERSDIPGNLKSLSSGEEKAGKTENTLKSLKSLLSKYEEADDEMKENADLAYCMGIAYITVGDIEGAITEFERAVELSGDREARETLENLRVIIVTS